MLLHFANVLPTTAMPGNLLTMLFECTDQAQAVISRTPATGITGHEEGESGSEDILLHGSPAQVPHVLTLPHSWNSSVEW